METPQVYSWDDLSKELEYIQMKYGNCEYIPGMEGFFMRIIGTLWNDLRRWANWYISCFYVLREIFRQDWIKYCHSQIARVASSSAPSDEQFSGTVAIYSDKHTIDTALKNVNSLIKINLMLPKIIANPGSFKYSPEQLALKQALENHHCVINFEKPSKSKCAAITAFTQPGRLGNQGYGSSVMSWAAAMNKNLDGFGAFYNELVDSGKLQLVVNQVENDIKQMNVKAENMSDKERLKIAQRSEIVMCRLKAFKALNKAGVSYWKANLWAGVILPLARLGKNIGTIDDLTSWILSTKKGDSDD